MVSDGAKKVLDGAIALIADPLDWCRNGPGSALRAGDTGSRCVFYALHHARHRLGLRMEDVRSAYDSVKALLPMQRDPSGKLGQFVQAWNDTPGRTHAEVLDLLRRAKESHDGAPGQ